MNISTFWSIIEQTHNENTEIHYDNLYTTLLEYPIEDIAYFSNYLSVLVGLAETPESYLACRMLNHHASDDTELYFRFWLVAQGKSIYDALFTNMDLMATIDLHGNLAQFEQLMGLPLAVLDEKVDEPWTAIEGYAIDEEVLATLKNTYVSKLEWGNDEDELWEQVQTVAPKLYEKSQSSSVSSNDLDASIDDFLDRIEHGNIESIEAELKRFVETIKPEPVVEESEYTQMGYLTGGRIRIMDQHRKYGFTDKDGKVVIEPKYDTANDFDLALSEVSIAGKRGFINKKGIEVVPLIYSKFSEWGFSDGVVGAVLDILWGSIDKKGNTIIPFEYQSVLPFREGFSFVSQHGKYALIDKKGFPLTDFIYDNGGMFINGRCVLRRDGLECVIDENGQEIVPPIYRQIESFYQYSYAIVFKDYGASTDNKNVGVIGRDGKEIIPAIYDNMRINDRTPEKIMAILDGVEYPFDISSHIVEKPKKK